MNYKIHLTVRTDLPHPLDVKIMKLFRELRGLIAKRAGARISAANKGKPKSAEHRRNIGAARKANGYTHSAETRAKIGNANRGRRLTPAHRANISRAKLAA